MGGKNRLPYVELIPPRRVSSRSEVPELLMKVTHCSATNVRCRFAVANTSRPPGCDRSRTLWQLAPEPNRGVGQQSRGCLMVGSVVRRSLRQRGGGTSSNVGDDLRLFHKAPDAVRRGLKRMPG